jgi:hypothetical protein
MEDATALRCEVVEPHPEKPDRQQYRLERGRSVNRMRPFEPVERDLAGRFFGVEDSGSATAIRPSTRRPTRCTNASCVARTFASSTRRVSLPVVGSVTSAVSSTQ